MDWLKKYLLNTAMRFAPPDTPAEGEDERIEVDLDDDEVTTDPVDETDEGDDEGDDDQPDDAATAAGGDEPPARQTRGDRTVGELRRVARERAEENARLTREMAEMRGRLDQISRQPAAPVETAQQRAERMALMSPEERAMEMVNESLQRHERNQQQITNQLLDQSDRTSYEAVAASQPLLKKLTSQVETMRQGFIQRGEQVPNRIAIATYLIGQKVLEQQGKGKPAAAQRRRAQQARPTGGRSDVASPRRERGRTGDGVADFENKFGDVPI